VPEPRLRAVAVLLVALVALAAIPSAAGAPPTLPVELGRAFLSNLTLPAATPGGASTLGYAVADPLPEPLGNVSLTFSVYAFNPYPGTGTTGVPADGPQLSAMGASGSSVNLTTAHLAAHTSGWSVPVEVSVPAAAPAGSYAIRDSLSFDLNGTRYVLESIGNFPPAEWQRANVLANGSPTINLSALGISGILPETALLVHNPAPLTYALWAVLGAGVAFALAGGYVALRRRGPASRSGATAPPPESQAPSALGKRRSKDGD
jgi:hypothetical protein